MTVKSYIFLLQKINFTDHFYAPPVVMVTAKRVNNDSHLSGCNVITAWVEVIIGTDLSTAYPSVVGGFFEILQDQTSVIVFFKEMANYLNKIFKRKTNMKIRQTVSNQILQLIPQF